MLVRYGLIAAVLGLAAVALWHPNRTPVVQSISAPGPLPSPASLPPLVGQGAGGRHHRHSRSIGGDDIVVYVAGAVKKPGLYHLHPGDRNAQAVADAGGFSSLADGGAVNLAQHAGDGDEVYVPAVGEQLHARSSEHRQPRRRHSLPPTGSIDVNVSSAGELAKVPGIGHALAQRIVELRDREGNFTSLDELLDVAGMTASRLERARPYLRDP